MALSLVITVDEFRLSGLSEHIEAGWRMMHEAPGGCPIGMEVDAPAKLGRCLACERRVNAAKSIRHGERLFCLGPSAPMIKKTSADDSGGGI
eukprot:2970094-Pyramimonas_sp.AAC.1